MWIAGSINILKQLESSNTLKKVKWNIFHILLIRS